MSQKLVSHNDDVRRLVEKGYSVAFDSGHLVIRDVPYLDDERQLRVGAIVSKFDQIDEVHIAQTDHQVFFAGSVPHGLDGSPVGNLAGGPITVALSDACADVVVERSFSNKPVATGSFADFFEKIESYVAIISGPAIELHGVSPYTFRTPDTDPETVFKFHDTLTSRAEITQLSNKLSNEVIAIIGVGGTGAYVLDFLAKTPVREIRLFDLDKFHVHNAFRSPGHLDSSELDRPKVEVYESRYASFRDGVKGTAKQVGADDSADFEGVTFAFVCVDNGSSRAGIFDLLIERRIAFIDVGMGLQQKDHGLDGMLRATYYSAEQGQATRDERHADLSDAAEDIYKTNIQIAELNALNACLAVIKFKQLMGFYHEEVPYYHLLCGVGDLNVVGESEHR